MNTFKVTTIVVNWKLKDETIGCIESILRSTIVSQIIVVDNGSGDGSAEAIAAHFPQIELFISPANLGFGAACNLAIRQAFKSDCEFIFLLNNDAILHPHALQEMLETAENKPGAGIFGPKVYNCDPRRTMWYAGARRRQGVLAAVDTGRGQVDQGQFDRRLEVDYVFGAAMLLRRRLLEQIGLFDESFFLYLEDLDLCLRAQKAGFSIHFVPTAHVDHIGSASTKNYLAWRKYHYVKSTILFLRKHASPAFFLPILGFWSLVFLRTVSSDLFKGDRNVILPYWNGLWDGLTEIRQKPKEPLAPAVAWSYPRQQFK